MGKILAFSGVKQSGKSSSVHYLIGLEMASLQLIDSFALSDDGELVVPTEHEGKLVDGVIDFNQVTPESVYWLSQNLWAYVQPYNFADHLKSLCTDVLGLTHEQCYGKDDDRNLLTEIEWESLPHYKTLKTPRPTGKMMAR